LLQTSDRLGEGSAPGFPVGLLEFGYLKPADQGGASNAGNPSSFFDIPLGEKSSNRLFLLAVELGAVALHQTLPSPIWPSRSTPAAFLRNRSNRLRIALLVFPTGVMNVIAADTSAKGKQPK